MRKFGVLFLLLVISNYCFSQTKCNVSGLKEKIHQTIESDKQKQDNLNIIEQLTLSIDYDSMKDNGFKNPYHIFSFSTGFTFRFYVLSSDLNNNGGILNIYKRSEDDSQPNILLAEVRDIPGDNKVSILEFVNTETSDFLLELSLDKEKSGCALAVVTAYPTR